MKMKAVWNGKVIAESNKTINIEGNQYFPAETVKKEFLQPSDTHIVCPWKVRYTHIVYKVIETSFTLL